MMALRLASFNNDFDMNFFPVSCVFNINCLLPLFCANLASWLLPPLKRFFRPLYLWSIHCCTSTDTLQFERETGQQRRIYRSRKDTYGGQRKTCIAVKNTNLYYFSGLRPDPRFIALAPQGFRCRYLCFLEDRWPWSASWGDRKFRLFLTGNCVFDDRLRWLSALFPFS